MDDKELTATALVSQAVAEAVKAIRAEDEAKVKAEADRKALVEEGYKAGLAEGEKKAKAWIAEKAPATMKVAKLGSGGVKGDMDAFMHFIATGDEMAAKRGLEEAPDAGEQGQGTDPESRKALSSGSGAAGEFLVPDDFVENIISKRDAISFPRLMGVSTYQTNLKVVDLPAENTSLTNFTRTAELASYSTNDPAFAQNQVTVQKWTKVTRFSEELLEDNAAGLAEWYARAVARAMAQTEAYYVAVGNGTNQHSGIFESGDTDAFTYNTDNGMDSDFAGIVVPSALWQHYFDLGEGYRTDAAWLMDPVTLSEILSQRSTKSLEWAAADLVSINPVSGQISLLGRPAFTQHNISTNAASVGFIAFGSPFFYTLVERKGLTVQRNPYLYQATGEIGIFNSFRQSGTVTVEEAWNIGVGV